MNTQPLVSIAIPAYKAKHLAVAIHSVLQQSYRQLELIVVNDHSPENIDHVIEGFNDSRIRYHVNSVNCGAENPANNWNKCLSYAKGEFFALLCDDDYYESDFISEMLALAEKHPATSVFRSRADVVDSDGWQVDKYASSPEWESWDDYLWHVCRNYRTQTISEWFFRTETLRQAGGYSLLPLAWYADYLSVFHFSVKGGIASTSKILVHFRQSGENISSRNDANTIQKIEATRQFRNAVSTLLNDNPNKPQMMLSLDKLLKMHLKYHLGFASVSMLFCIFLQRKQLGIKKSLLWHALWHKEK